MINIEEKYFTAYETIKNKTKGLNNSVEYPALGFTSNLDVVCDFRIDIFNRLLKKHFPDGRLEEMHAVKYIKNIQDFLCAIVFFARQGIGGEVDICDMEIITNIFETEYAMGGTATQAALALSAIDLASLVHLTDDSSPVCDILNTSNIYIANAQGELVHANNIRQTNEQEVHFIVQFKKGDIIELNKEQIVIPSSNRLIVTKITVNAVLPLSQGYFDFIENHSKKISSHVLSSFNAVEDEQILRDRLDYIKKHLAIFRKNNEKGIVFFEDAHYHNKNIRKICLETIYKEVDIVSLNEEELEYTLKMEQYDVDIRDIIACVDGMCRIKQVYGIKKGVIVHTKDYSMYVGDALEVDIEAGLIYGNMLATTKALIGTYGSIDDIHAILKLPLSDQGIKYKKIIDDKNHESKCTAQKIVIVPTKYIEKPKYTVGLGDSFVAGVQICFKK